MTRVHDQHLTGKASRSTKSDAWRAKDTKIARKSSDTTNVAIADGNISCSGGSLLKIFVSAQFWIKFDTLVMRSQ